MLDEEQVSAGSEHAPHFSEGCTNLGNAAAHPRHHDRIHAVFGQRDTFGGTQSGLPVERAISTSVFNA
jgi:hypothetical protein